ncbi:hypothetical protein ASF53_05165 [Methylobacterium sp. Leaf123]|uniref:DUF1376 domain-containing protein n=1 Tax=Methylobacterium sp. Leaf123 TaxID=1736264 RepID=UPI0007018989|nr:DUF1376 domain-containing protein [Methylobacterium sp. Leaf123]KQQ23717.1 hypothetical protein ASF53_05165 [Methylobacterium sp. Leaf123]
MVGFYKHDIPAWMDGTEALSDGAYRAYHVIVQLIMLNEGPIALNERGLAGRCNQTLKLFLRHLDELVRAGKLVVEGGRISNSRAARELDSVQKNRENAGKGGKISGQRRKNPADLENGTANLLQNNEPSEVPLHKDRSLKEKRREDTPVVPKGTEPEGFAEFWAAYPRRRGDNPRKTALKAYAAAIGRGATPAAMMVGVGRYAAHLAEIGKIGTEFVAQASTWLNQDRFEPPTGQAGPLSGQPPDHSAYLAGLTDDDWRRHVQGWRRTGGQWLLAQRTAPPDDPRTLVPQRILDEFSIPAAGAPRQLAMVAGGNR